MIRKIVFWTHLSCGVSAGLVILMMCVTGVILTYERQMLDWANRDLYSAPEPDTVRRPIESLVAAVEHDERDFSALSVTISADPAAPVLISGGRSGSRYVNPYTAEPLGEGATGLQQFFGAVTGWHRWFNASGPGRGTWRTITDASNFMFLFLVLSGMYLWLPRVYKWAAFRTRLLFNAQALKSGHARDFNWHHVIGIWTAIPLAVVVATAVIFSYSWANDLVYRAFGEEPPRRGPPPTRAPTAQASTPAPAGPGSTLSPASRTGPAAGAESRAPDEYRLAIAEPSGSNRAANRGVETVAARALSLDELFARAADHLDSWQRITVNLPRGGATGDGTVRFSIDQGTGGQPQLRHTLALDARSGAVVDWQPFQSQSPGRRARTWARFLHTGEALGIAGQTIAGLVSLTSAVMVWTGLALAYRRLIVPLFRRRV